jgi:hypothetical protein
VKLSLLIETNSPQTWFAQKWLGASGFRPDRVKMGYRGASLGFRKFKKSCEELV